MRSEGDMIVISFAPDLYGTSHSSEVPSTENIGSVAANQSLFDELLPILVVFSFLWKRLRDGASAIAFIVCCAVSARYWER